MDTPTTPRRRHFTPAFRAEIIASCNQPCASIADIAHAHGLRAELVRRWIRKHRAASPLADGPHPAFAPVCITPTPTEPTTIQIDIRRGATHIKIHCPGSAAAACTHWLREGLK
jgi:transposase